MYSKILYALDVNEHNGKNIEKAAQIAQLHHAELHAINVVRPIAANYAYTGLLIDDQIEKDILEESKKVLTNQLKSHPEIKFDVLIGDPTEAILSYAKEHAFSAVLLNGHQHNVFGRLGSVADKVVNHSDIDVIILK